MASLLKILIFLTLLVPAGWAAPVFAEAVEIELSDEVSVPVARFAAAGERPVLLWLPGSRGIRPSMHTLAARLAGAGIETWLADLHAAYFVDIGRASVAAFPDEDVAALIDAVHRSSDRRVVVVGGGRGAANVLGGIRALQVSARPMSVVGAVLFSPLLHVAPTPGEAAAWLPVARATNVPVFIVQPGNSTAAWRIDEAARVLREGGSPVFLKRLPGVQSGYLAREEDANDADLAARSRAPRMLRQGIDLLSRLPAPAAPAPAVAATVERDRKRSRFGFRPMRGEAPSMLELPTASGATGSLRAAASPVTLVSFWASWCQPCIEELPSLSRLFGDYATRGLQVVAVNVGEDAETIAPVIDRFDLDRYELLMDRDGAEMRRWNVYGFPTNFLLDADGRVRYGSFGAVAWDDADVRDLVESLFLDAGAEAQP